MRWVLYAALGGEKWGRALKGAGVVMWVKSKQDGRGMENCQRR